VTRNLSARAPPFSAYANFFASITGKRKGRWVGHPRFKSRKDTRQSFRLTRNGFAVRPSGRLFLAKAGEVRVRWSRALPSEASSVTVIRDRPCGARWRGAGDQALVTRPRRPSSVATFTQSIELR
jgi:transposase